PELVPGVLDVRGQIVPRARLVLGRLDVVEDVVEVDLAQIAAPLGQRAREEVVETLVPELAHPVRLVLLRRAGVDALVRDAAAGPTSSFTPPATTRSASMSRPESVSSSTAIRGFSIAIWRISTRFFSPPENPSFRYRCASSRGIRRR